MMENTGTIDVEFRIGRVGVGSSRWGTMPTVPLIEDGMKQRSEKHGPTDKANSLTERLFIGIQSFIHHASKFGIAVNNARTANLRISSLNHSFCRIFLLCLSVFTQGANVTGYPCDCSDLVIAEHLSAIEADVLHLGFTKSFRTKHRITVYHECDRLAPALVILVIGNIAPASAK